MYLKKLRAEFLLPRFLDQTLPCGLFQVQAQFSPWYGVLVIHFLFLKFLLEYIELVPSSVLLVATPWTTRSPLGSSIHGILQARVLEWVAMPSSGGSSQPRYRSRVSCVSCRWILYH